MTEDDPLLTTQEAAALIRRRAATVRSWVVQGRLVPVEMVKGKLYLRRSDVLAVGKATEKCRGRNRNRPNRDPTAEELEAIVDEQSRRLPRWWWADCRKLNGPILAAVLRERWEAKYGKRAKG